MRMGGEGTSFGNWIMDALPSASKQAVAFLVIGVGATFAYFSYLANPIQAQQAKIEQHDAQLVEHQRKIDEQAQKLEQVLNTVNSIMGTVAVQSDKVDNLGSGQTRQQNSLDKLNDKIDRLLERR